MPKDHSRPKFSRIQLAFPIPLRLWANCNIRTDPRQNNKPDKKVEDDHLEAVSVHEDDLPPVLEVLDDVEVAQAGRPASPAAGSGLVAMERKKINKKIKLSARAVFFFYSGYTFSIKLV